MTQQLSSGFRLGAGVVTAGVPTIVAANSNAGVYQWLGTLVDVDPNREVDAQDATTQASNRRSQVAAGLRIFGPRFTCQWDQAESGTSVHSSDEVWEDFRAGQAREYVLVWPPGTLGLAGNGPVRWRFSAIIASLSIPMPLGRIVTASFSFANWQNSTWTGIIHEIQP